MSSDIFDYKFMRALGGRISKKHKIFEMLAMLGFAERETYSLMLFVEWLEKNPKTTPFEIAKKFLEFYGNATFLRETNEITRLSMIIGDTRDEVEYER